MEWRKYFTLNIWSVIVLILVFINSGVLFLTSDLFVIGTEGIGPPPVNQFINLFGTIIFFPIITLFVILRLPQTIYIFFVLINLIYLIFIPLILMALFDIKWYNKGNKIVAVSLILYLLLFFATGLLNL